MYSRFQSRRFAVQLAGILSVMTLLGLAGCGPKEVTTNQGNSTNGSNANQSGNQNDNQDPNGEDAPAFEEYSTAIDESRCELIIDCCSADQRESEFGMDATDVDECVTAEEGIFGGLGLGGFALEQSLEDGRIDFDEAMAEMCQESIQELSCGEFDGTKQQTDSLPGCEDMIAGLVDAGGACSTNYECTTGFCLHDSDGEEGECQSIPDLGSECPNNECGPEAYCDRFDNVCKDLRMSGDPCAEDEECLSGYCDSGDGDQMTCQERSAVCE